MGNLNGYLVEALRSAVRRYREARRQAGDEPDYDFRYLPKEEVSEGPVRYVFHTSRNGPPDDK